MKYLGWIDTGIEKFSNFILVISVLVMLLVSVMTIVLRWFETSFMWGEPLIRHLVFLCTFLGGVVATGRGTHIGIDILGRYLENRGSVYRKKSLHILVSLSSLLVLIWLVVSSLHFVNVELQYGRAIFWGIHSGYLVAIIPFGFFLIGYRFFYKFICAVFNQV